MSAKRKCRESSKLLPRFRLYTCILSGMVVTHGVVRFLTFGALEVCYDVDIFQPMKIHVPKIMNLQRCENEITAFNGFYLDTTEVALKLSKKYESVRLYLHWPNVPTLTLTVA